jgi:hypothetical protein
MPAKACAFPSTMRVYVLPASWVCQNIHHLVIRDAPSVRLGTFIIATAAYGAMPFFMTATEHSVIFVYPFKKTILPTLFAE